MGIYIFHTDIAYLLQFPLQIYPEKNARKSNKKTIFRLNSNDQIFIRFFLESSTQFQRFNIWFWGLFLPRTLSMIWLRQLVNYYLLFIWFIVIRKGHQVTFCIEVNPKVSQSCLMYPMLWYGIPSNKIKLHRLLFSLSIKFDFRLVDNFQCYIVAANHIYIFYSIPN